MGSSTSKLVSPKDYDKDKFNKIMKLYDFLDQNGDRVITSEEMNKFCNIYYECDHEDKENRINETENEEHDKINDMKKDIENKVQSRTQEYYTKNKKQELVRTQKKELMEFTYKETESINDTARDYDNERDRLRLEIEFVNDLNQNEKNQKLMEDIGHRNFKEIEFKYFFRFIKNKNVDKMATILDNPDET